MENPQDAQQLCSKLSKIVENCTELTVQQYAFTRIEEILGLANDYQDTDTEVFGTKHAPLFTIDGKNLFDGPFVRALNSTDPYVLRSASNGLACLLTVCEGNVNRLIEWINTQLTSPSWILALPALGMTSRGEKAKNRFVASGGVGHIVTKLRDLGVNGNAQQIYELTFVLWSLSLGPETDVDKFLAAGTVFTLSELISSAPSRKVVRMSVGALRNLVAGENDDVLTEIYTSNLPRLLETMIQSNAHKLTGDPEFEADVKALHDSLTSNYRELSTFDKWESQVRTGALRCVAKYIYLNCAYEIFSESPLIFIDLFTCVS